MNGLYDLRVVVDGLHYKLKGPCAAWRLRDGVVHATAWFGGYCVLLCTCLRPGSGEIEHRDATVTCLTCLVTNS